MVSCIFTGDRLFEDFLNSIKMWRQFNDTSAKFAKHLRMQKVNYKYLCCFLKDEFVSHATRKLPYIPKIQLKLFFTLLKQSDFCCSESL